MQELFRSHPLDLCFHMLKLFQCFVCLFVFFLYSLFRNTSPPQILNNNICIFSKLKKKSSDMINVFALFLSVGSLAGPFYASIFFICEMITKFCLLLAWSNQNTNKGSGVIVSAFIIDGRIFTVICFNTGFKNEHYS